MLAAAGLPLKQSEPAWPEFKPHTRFGQLPHLQSSDGLEVSQSAAICRVLARRGGLVPASEPEFAVSEMLMEEYGDLLNALGKAMYGGPLAERPARFAALLAPGGGARAHLAHFESLLAPGAASFTTAVSVGECAVACALHVLLGLEPSILAEGLPGLARFWAARGPRTAAALAGLAPYYHPASKEE